MNLTGNEGKIYSEEELNDGIQNYGNTFSQDSNFTAFQVYGEKFIQSLMQVEGSRAIKLINVIDADGQTGVALIPIDKHGNELPVLTPETESDEAADDPVKCPPICNR